MVELGSSKTDQISSNGKHSEEKTDTHTDHGRKSSTDSNVRRRRSKRDGKMNCHNHIHSKAIKKLIIEKQQIYVMDVILKYYHSFNLR